MPVAVQVQTMILPGHRIEIQSDDLPEGRTATVWVVVDEAAPPKRRLSEILANYSGGALFQTAEQVDAYLRAERDSWDS
jgi:hypothetical protein